MHATKGTELPKQGHGSSCGLRETTLLRLLLAFLGVPRLDVFPWPGTQSSKASMFLE